ncbi:MAG: hypothetical protein K0Q79_2683 [Flavipsychrobacter sp.]|jgi:hypothetical protein|nr:hypothetical protein [Flavipsychrobacter sp.]
MFQTYIEKQIIKNRFSFRLVHLSPCGVSGHFSFLFPFYFFHRLMASKASWII